MPIDTIISGGRIVTHAETLETDIAIDGGKIVALGERDVMPTAQTEIDATGYLVLPGAVDPHVHVDDMFSRDSYTTATKAAALGGTTTLIDFAWSGWAGNQCPWDTKRGLKEAIDSKKAKARESVIDFGLHAGIMREAPELIAELPGVVDEGVTSFKMFTTYEFGLGNGFINRTMECLAEIGAVGMVHTEDGSICDDLTDQMRNEGRKSPTEYPKSRPDYAEAMAADDLVNMAVEHGTKYYGVHTTNEKSASVFDSVRSDVAHVRAETCTHYTTKTEAIYQDLGSLATGAPPLRTPADVDSMFDKLEQDVLSVVSSDHCAYFREDKEVDAWWDGEFGVNGIQTRLPVFYDEAVNRRGFDQEFVVRVLCTNPARTFGLSQKGRIAVGADADLVLFDPNDRWTITANDLESKADFTIYDGREVTGRVVRTLLRGTTIAEDGSIVSEPGYGEFIHRGLPDWNGDR